MHHKTLYLIVSRGRQETVKFFQIRLAIYIRGEISMLIKGKIDYGKVESDKTFSKSWV